MNFPGNYAPAYGDTKQYVTSTVPYLTSSLTIPATGSDPLAINFPYVSQWVVIKNTLPISSPNVTIKFGISVLGTHGIVTNNYGELTNQESFESNWKVKSIYLITDSASQASGSVIAGLTTIDIKDMPKSSAGFINHSGSIGVG